MLIGRTVGSYVVVGKLGEGGMGEVYRAHDSRLKRDVAIKVLPREVAADADRLARFEREAQLLASLNHPNIAHVYGLDESGGVRGLVMELVEGPTLADPPASPRSVDDILAIARQIVEALDAAHSAGVIHRDLKPANIKVRPDGTVKVLDFGLAKALDGAGGTGGAGGAGGAGKTGESSPTITTPAMTRAGVILGTAAYMSPEQARGRFVDKRVDIWAFGIVLYELLTGTRLFGGETVSETIAEVLKTEPDWTKLPPDTPPAVRRLLQRCLQRDAKARLRDIGDALPDLAATGEPAATVAGHQPAAGSFAMIAAVVAVTGALGAAAGWLVKPAPAGAPRRVIRTSAAIPGALLLTSQRPLIAVSPDSRYVVVVANGSLQLRSLDSDRWVTLEGGSGIRGVFFSPDGQSIGFWNSLEIKKITVSGTGNAVLGKVNPVASAAGPFGAWWSEDGQIYYAEAATGIHAIPAAGGAPRLVVKGDSLYTPYVIKGTRTLLYARSVGNRAEIFMRDIDGGDATLLTEGSSPRLLSSGHLVFARGTTLFAARMDLASRRLVEDPVPVLEQVAMMGNASQFDVAADGTLVYMPGANSMQPSGRLLRVGRTGTGGRLSDAVHEYSDPRVSRDGQRVALHLSEDSDDAWIHDLARGTLTRLTYGPSEDETPVWSPDSQSIAYASDRGGTRRAVVRRRADGGGAEEDLLIATDHIHVTDWSPDGKTVVIEALTAERRSDILLVDVSTPGKSRPFLATPFAESSGRISPDGRWLAYQSAESGRDEIYVQAFPAGGGKVQVSSSGGTQPVWARDGRELFFRSDTQVMSARVVHGGAFNVEPPAALFKDSFSRPQGTLHTTYDVLPGGDFLFVELIESQFNSQSPLMVAIFNWADQLKATGR